MSFDEAALTLSAQGTQDTHLRGIKLLDEFPFGPQDLLNDRICDRCKETWTGRGLLRLDPMDDRRVFATGTPAQWLREPCP